MSKEVTVDYIRCPECSYVYEATLDKCPQCQKETVINEEALTQEVFNLNDQVFVGCIVCRSSLTPTFISQAIIIQEEKWQKVKKKKRKSHSTVAA